MNKVLKSFVCGLALIGLVLVPACRTKKTPPPVVAPTVTTTSSTPPPPIDTTVKPPEDFVKTDTVAAEPKVTVEALPADIDELNRVAQQRGLLADAFFGYDEATLSANAQAALTTSANWLKQNPGYNLLIEGHCDERGTEQYNLALGDRRANIAREFLATLGVDASRIRTVSYGEERPFDPGHDETAWAKNRRDHLVLVGK
ncbi:MAG: peptidoglycan-associated lipoprotein Pal [Thermoanaerobaculia bacterium]